MPTVFSHLTSGFRHNEHPEEASPAASSVVANVAAGLDHVREGMSHREFRELARARSAAYEEAWQPIRTAARHRGAR